MNITKRYLLFLLAGAVIFSACSSLKPKPEKPDRTTYLLQMAEGAFLEGNYIASLKHLAEAEKSDSSRREIFQLRALIYYKKKEPAKAIDAARTALDKDPQYSAAHNTLGRLLLETGQKHEAIEHLERAADDELNDEAFIARTNLGIAYYEMGQYVESRQYLDKAINDAPQATCVALLYRGHLSFRLEKFSDAIRDYEKSTQQLCGAFSDGYYALGVAYVKTHEYEKARKKFLEIQQLFPQTQVAEKAIRQLRYLP